METTLAGLLHSQVVLGFAHTGRQRACWLALGLLSTSSWRVRVCGPIPRFVSAEGYCSTSVSSPTRLSERRPAQPHSYASHASHAPCFHSGPELRSGQSPALSLVYSHLASFGHLICCFVSGLDRSSGGGATLTDCQGLPHGCRWLRSGCLPQLFSARLGICQSAAFTPCASHLGRESSISLVT